MDKKNKFSSKESSVSSESEGCGGNFQTPSNSPSKIMKERHYFCTPLNSPSKGSPDAEISLLIMRPSPLIFSDSVSDDRSNSFWKTSNAARYTQKDSTNLKFPFSESPVSDGEESKASPRYHPQPESKETKGLNLASPIVSGNSTERTDSKNPYVPQKFSPCLKFDEMGNPDCDVTINLEDNGRDLSEEPRDVLKKFTMSPEFLYLKNSLTTDEDERKEKVDEKDSFETERPLLLAASTKPSGTQRKSSLTSFGVKYEFSLPRKSSLNGLDSKAHFRPLPISFSDKNLNFIEKPIEERDKSCEKDSVYRTGLNRKPTVPDDRMEEPWSLKNLTIFESSPSVRNNSVCEGSSSSYDVTKLKKPSTHLGDLLEYCKKNSNCTSKTVQALSKNSHPKSFLNPGFHSSKKISPSGKNSALLSSKEKCRNLSCCIKQYRDSEVLLKDSKNLGRDSPPDARYSISDKWGNHWKRSDSETNKNPDKNNGKRTVVETKGKEPLEKNIKLIKFQRADQSYCDLLKHQHEQVKKHRLKMPKKRLERICRSDPPDKTISAETCDCDCDCDCDQIDFNDFHRFEETRLKNLGCNKCKGKVNLNLERIQSFYDNKISSDRIQSTYENPTIITGETVKPIKTETNKKLSFYEENDAKSEAGLVQASWWPVAAEKGHGPEFAWAWIPSFEVGLTRKSRAYQPTLKL